MNFSCLSDGMDQVMVFGGGIWFLGDVDVMFPLETVLCHSQLIHLSKGGHAGGFLPPCS